jgi:glycosyltransferase involved in cell wall biosynthesis
VRVAIDARSLLSGRGVARHVRRTLEAAPDDLQWRAVVPGRTVVRPISGVELVRHRLGGRALYGAAAFARRPRLEALAGGADVAWIPAPAPVALGVPYVLTLHDLSWEQRPGDFTAYERAWHRLARPRALARRARSVLAVSAATAAAAAEHWGVHATVVPQGVDRPPPGVVRHDGDYVLFVGALEPRKAPDALVRAFARAATGGELLIVGRGRLEGELRRAAVPGVRLLGAVDDATLHGLYAGARALVAPSLLEGYGLPPLEAALHGTPAIVSDLPVFRETLGAGALFVAPGDEDALTEALRAPRLPGPTADPPTWEQSAAALADALRA